MLVHLNIAKILFKPINVIFRKHLEVGKEILIVNEIASYLNNYFCGHNYIKKQNVVKANKHKLCDQ